SIFLVAGLGGMNRRFQAERVLLTGVVLAAGWGALVGFLLAFSPEQALRGMLFWLMGDMAYAETPWLSLGVLFLGLALVWPWHRAIDLLTLGEGQAASLGVTVGALRLGLFVVAALLTALAVTTAGSVGFVGLVVPHALRLAGLRRHGLLLPGAVLGGGVLLLAADTLARTLWAPRQIPVGVVTALVGVPLFLILMRRELRT
ncbi:MAG: iron ABC transporter permease, partial [Magnetococcales bacterium]|nr:iron ABC transporter permease [Magnetococcales bacterium]